MLRQPQHRNLAHARPLPPSAPFSLSDFDAFHYRPKPSTKENAVASTPTPTPMPAPVPRAPSSSGKRVDSKWKDRQVIDIAIELHNLFEPSIVNEYNDVMSSKNMSMARINMSHRIAVAVNDAPSSKKALSAMGLSKESTHDDCIHGMNIAPSTLLHYCHAKQWSVVHVRGCVYYRTGPCAASDDDGDGDGDGSTESPKLEPVHIIHYDSNTLVCDADPTDIYRKYIALSNIKKPLQSIHSYKLSDLNLLMSKLNAWRSENNQHELSGDVLKKDIYNTLSSNIPHF